MLDIKKAPDDLAAAREQENLASRIERDEDETAPGEVE